MKNNINEALPEKLNAELMPKHVAFILDGNRRWAKERGLPVELGHEEGKRVMMELTFLSSKWGIKVLSLFVFSTENWTRPSEEVELLMGLFEQAMGTFADDFNRYNVRLTFMGDRSKLRASLLDVIESAEDRTKSKNGLHVFVGLNYSGRYDIMQATKSIVAKVRDGELRVEDIDEALFEGELETGCSEHPVPDLMIRTSGERRISNFMLWQLAEAELVFVEKNFPEIEERDYADALALFQGRRYGRAVGSG